MTCSPGISPNGSPLQKSPLPDSSTPQPALGFLTISLHTIDHQPRGAITFAHNGCRKLRLTLTILPVSRCPPSIWVDTHTPPPTCNKRGAENGALTVHPAAWKGVGERLESGASEVHGLEAAD